VEIFTRLNAVWRTSAEVEVWVFGSDPIKGEMYLATHTFVSMVLVNRNENLEPYFFSEEVLEEANLRKNLRLERKNRLISSLST
jgi:acyl-CoA hydrolase